MKGHMRPRVCVDVQTKRARAFSRLPANVVLSPQDVVRIPLTGVLKTCLAVAAVLYFSMSAVLLAPVGAQNDTERAELERQLADLEKEMAQYESEVAQRRAAGNSLEGEIQTLNAKINKINLQIKSITLSLSRLDGEIKETTLEIDLTQRKIELAKNALQDALRNLYENERQGLIVLLLRNEQFSDFFGDVNNLLEVQNTLSVTVGEITALRNELLDKNEALAIQRDDATALKVFQDSQRAALSGTKNQKANILEITRGEEARYKELLKETQKTAAQIRSQIFQLIGGGELSFEQAYQFAKFAENATGVRAAMILAVLDRESALGQNVGRCSYETAMHPTRDIPVFLRIIEDLKRAGEAPPEPILVSCAISQHGAYGGAMGPAQFIPSTWALYENRIAQITGSKVPSPWRNADAFVATGLYLKDAYNTNACRNYVSEYSNVADSQILADRCAAARYYSGGNWWNYRWIYGDPVVEHARAFQQDIDILNS